MPVTLTAPVWSADAADPPRKRWTREECSALEKAGLVEPRRYELIEGELIRKMGKNHPHMRAVHLLLEWLKTVVGRDLVVQEPTIDVGPNDHPTSEPEPDVVVLRESILRLSQPARPSEIVMLAEVSDTTLAFDLQTKAGLYARAAIPEYWVVDINGRRIIVHREPQDGTYRSISAYAEDELIASQAAPDAAIRVGDLL